MEIYKNQIETRNMNETVIQLYEDICKIFTINSKINNAAMCKMQSLGYNGFKRWHRYRSREFNELRFCLENELYDKFRIVPTFKEYEVDYSPKDMEEHLKSWDKELLDSIRNLGELNQRYYELIGINCKIIEKAIHKIIRDYEKVGRLIKRFTESDWLTLDMHIVDDKIHCKYKGKEEKHGYKY